MHAERAAAYNRLKIIPIKLDNDFMRTEMPVAARRDASFLFSMFWAY